MGARGNVTAVTECEGGPGTSPSHNPKRKQSGAAAEQLRKGQIDRIFPSEREIAPTVSNKTEEGVAQPTASFFFPLSPPTHLTLEHNDTRPQTPPHLIPFSCSLPQADALCSPCLRPANTDARAPLHHPEATTPAVFTAAEVSATGDSPQGESKAEPFAEAYWHQDPASRPTGGYQVVRRRVRQAQVSQAPVQEPFAITGEEFPGAG